MVLDIIYYFVAFFPKIKVPKVTIYKISKLPEKFQAKFTQQIYIQRNSRAVKLKLQTELQFYR